MSTLKIVHNMAAAQIELAIKSIGNRGAALDKDIQLTGLSVLAHIEQHKEVSLLVKLHKAMPKGSRSNALVAWALAFGSIAVNLDKTTAKDRPFLYAKDKATDLDGATKKPWFDFKKEKAPAEAFNLELEFLSFMARVDKAIKAGEVNPTDSIASALVTQASTAKDRIEGKAKAAAAAAPEATVTAPSAEPVPGVAVAADAE